MSLSAYATSAFSKHSLISTVLVVQNVVNGREPEPCRTKPIMIEVG